MFKCDGQMCLRLLLIACAWHVTLGTPLKDVTSFSDGAAQLQAKPGEALYYLLADADTSHVGPNDELTRTQRNALKKFWDDLFGQSGCTNCCNNNYNVGNGAAYYPPPSQQQQQPPQGPQPQYWPAPPQQPFQPFQLKGFKPFKAFKLFDLGKLDGFGCSNGCCNQGGGYAPPPNQIAPASYGPPSSGAYNAGPPQSSYGPYQSGGNGAYGPYQSGGSGAGSYSAPSPPPPPSQPADNYGPPQAYTEKPSSGYDAPPADNGSYNEPPPTATDDSYKPPESQYASEKPVDSYQEPAPPAEGPSYEEQPQSKYDKPEPSYKSEGYRGNQPQIVYQPVIMVNPQYIRKGGLGDVVNSLSRGDVDDASNTTPESASQVKELQANEYQQEAQPVEQIPEPEPEAPVPQVQPAPAPVPQYPFCGYPAVAIPFYGFSPQITPVYGAPCSNGNAGSSVPVQAPVYQPQLPSYQSPLPAPYQPVISQQQPPAPSPYQSVNSQPQPQAPLYSPSNIASYQPQPPQPQQTSTAPSAPTSYGAAKPNGVTVSTIYTVISQPSAGGSSPNYAPSQVQSAPPQPNYAQQPAPVRATPQPLPAPSPPYNQPIQMSLADQPYRECPELFAEYNYRLANVKPRAAATGGGGGNTYVNAQVIGL